MQDPECETRRKQGAGSVDFHECQARQQARQLRDIEYPTAQHRNPNGRNQQTPDSNQSSEKRLEGLSGRYDWLAWAFFGLAYGNDSNILHFCSIRPFLANVCAVYVT